VTQKVKAKGVLLAFPQHIICGWRKDDAGEWLSSADVSGLSWLGDMNGIQPTKGEGHTP